MLHSLEEKGVVLCDIVNSKATAHSCVFWLVCKVISTATYLVDAPLLQRDCLAPERIYHTTINFSVVK